MLSSGGRASSSMPKTKIYSGRRVDHVAMRINKKQKNSSYHGSTKAHGFGFVGVLFGVTVVSIAGLYLSVINASAVRGSSIFELEKKIAQVESEREELRIREAALRARVQSSEVIEQNDMKPIEIADYIILMEKEAVAIER